MKASIYDKIQTYFEVDQQLKALEKTKKPLNAELKALMVEAQAETLTVNGITAAYTKQERVSINEELLVAKLKALGLFEAVIVKEIPDHSKIEELIWDRKLDATLLEECTSVNYVEVLTVKKASKRKQQGGPEIYGES